MKNNELFTVRPSLKQYYGRTVTKELEFEETNESGEVVQTLKNCVLTTKVKKTWEHGEIKNTLESVLTEELPEGTVLIWTEQEGYIVPDVPMYKLHDLEEEIRQVKEIYHENTDINPEG